MLILLLRAKSFFDRETLKQLPKLKLIAITATGTNNVDLVAAEEMGITVRNVTGYSSTTVSRTCHGINFRFKHSLAGWLRDQMEAKWSESKQFCYFDYPITDVFGSTLGVVGKGCLGTEVGRFG